MANINRVELSGNITREPELSVTKNGRPMLKFCLAVGEERGDKKHTNFITCIIWGGYADAMARYLHKGQKLALAGNLHYESWADPVSGYKRSRVEVYVREVDTIGPPPARDVTEYASGEQIPLSAAAPQVPAAPAADMADEEIPF